MAWFLLMLAGLFEMAWALFLKQSEGLTRPYYAVAFVVTLAISMILLAQSLKTLPVGTAYAIWTGIGAAGTAIFGMIWLGEARDPIKLISLALLIIGLIGLRVSGGD